MAAFDETTLTNRMMPKTWTCPHCGRKNRTGQAADSILLEHFKYLQHCECCGFVQFWRLTLSDSFKRQVVRMLKEGKLK